MTATPRRKRSARFSDIADAAGVSIATVDRVLNERGSVSRTARERVVAAARALGVPRLLPVVDTGLLHVDIVLPDNRSPFFQRLGQAFQRIIAMLDHRLVVHRVSVPDNDEAALLHVLAARRYPRRALIVAAPDSDATRQALRQAQLRGEHVVMVVTRVEGLAGAAYVGIDNYAAGRTAGHLIGRYCPRGGRVLILSSRRDYRGHRERSQGCRDALAGLPHLPCDAVSRETRDDPEQCYLALCDAFRGGEGIAAIYHTGAGSPGVVAALHRLADHKLCWVAHELSDDHRQYMQEGLLDVVIDQDPDTQALRAIQHMLAALGLAPPAPGSQQGGEFRLYVPENMPGGRYLAG
jgi:LacI family transcriptional regulator